MRLGWITCNALFAEKLLLLTDSTSQHANGLSQAVLCELLTPGRGWGIPGYLKWTESLRLEYARRRALFAQLFEKHVAQTGFARTTVPVAGMFFWIEVLLEKHPRSGSGSTQQELMESLFEAAFDSGLALIPATYFAIMPEHRVHDGVSATPDMEPKVSRAPPDARTQD